MCLNPSGRAHARTHTPWGKLTERRKLCVTSTSGQQVDTARK
jgi:hypothetical protein